MPPIINEIDQSIGNLNQFISVELIYDKTDQASAFFILMSLTQVLIFNKFTLLHFPSYI